MLEIVRKKAKIIVTVIIVLIIPSFVLFGVSSAISKRMANFAGRLNNKRISINTYNIAYNACSTREKMIYGENFNKISKYLFLEQKAWRRILLLQEAKAQGLKITNEELSARIESYPFFLEKGKFSQQRYYYIIARAFRLTPAQYEKQERENMLIEHLTESVINGVVVSEQEYYDTYKMENNKVKIIYSLINSTDFQNSMNLEDEKIKQFYEENKATFKKAEQRKIEYIKIPFADFSADITEKQTQEYYNNNKNLYKEEKKEEKNTKQENKETKTEQKDTYKPFAQVKEDIKQELTQTAKKQSAYAKIDKIIEQLLDGANISETCKELNTPLETTELFSSETTYLNNLQSAGRIIRQAFALETGGLSDIIEGYDAYYIIKVKEIRPASIPAFEDVKDEVIQKAKKELSINLAKTAASNFKEKTLNLMKSGKTFSQAAEELGIKASETNPFTSNSYIDGLGYAPEISKQAFKLKKNELSSIIQVDNGCLFFTPIEKINVSFEEYKKSKDLKKFKDTIMQQKKELVYKTWFNQIMKKNKISLNRKFFDENLEKQITAL